MAILSHASNLLLLVLADVIQRGDGLLEFGGPPRGREATRAAGLCTGFLLGGGVWGHEGLDESFGVGGVALGLHCEGSAGARYVGGQEEVVQRGGSSSAHLTGDAQLGGGRE